MIYYRTICFVLAGLLLYPSLAAASVMQPTPVRPHSPLDAAFSQCPANRVVDAQTVFRTPLDNTRMLALIAYTQSLSPVEQSTVIARSSQSLAPVFTTLSKVRGTPCAPVGVTFAGIRMAYGIIGRWKYTPDLRFLAIAIADAMNAIDLGPSVSDRIRDSALAIFSTSTTALDRIAAARLRPPASGSCRSIDATAIDPISPDLPDSDRGDLKGNVQVEVVLDRYGFVRLAALYHQTLNDTPSRSAAIASAIGAAASTSYLPQFSNCRTRPSAYLFRADFGP